MNTRARGRSRRIFRIFAAAAAAAAGIYFFLAPAAIISISAADRGWREDRIPALAFWLHRRLSPRFAAWASARVASGAAARVATRNISGTEWPVFSAAFYLWATETLQEAWDRDHTLASVAPKAAGQEAVSAAAALVADPGHATWVKDHWGPRYLERENAFYRMLRIAALASRAGLSGDSSQNGRLAAFVDSFTAELSASPFGLLEDYPGECYPGDVAAALYAISRADRVLGADHRAEINRGLRGFQGPLLDRRTGLPPYTAQAKAGLAGEARGCSNSYLLLRAPYLWPQTARAWYREYERHFWQERWGAVGFREFRSEEDHGDWYADVDAGPVLAGFGVSASAFGLGAARVNGRFDHAYPLAAQMLVSSWPLPDGRLLSSRILSDREHAPLLGETALLYIMTRRAAPGFQVRSGGSLTPCFWLGIALYLLAGGALVLAAWRELKNCVRSPLAKK